MDLLNMLKFGTEDTNYFARKCRGLGWKMIRCSIEDKRGSTSEASLVLGAS